MKRSGAEREQIIAEIARNIPSVYVPRYYKPAADANGAFAGLEKLVDDVPSQIGHARCAKLSDSPAITHPLVPLSEGIQERVVIEIMRGCPNGCRFCQAGATRLPVRIRSVDEILDIARQAIKNTGYRQISLLSLSTSDYPHLDELIERLSAEFTPQKVSISLPSLRVDKQLRHLPSLTSEVRKGGLTIAAEAASEQLRRSIGKNITEDDMTAGVKAAYQAGWKRVKIYFLAGLPGETPADIDAIFHLCKKLSDTGREVMGHRGAISASVSWFVPKPHTPMQWCPMQTGEYFWSVRRRLIELSAKSAVNFKFHRIERSILEAVICRGQRPVADVIEAAWRNGARMDAWNEHFDHEKWDSAFEQTGIDPTEIAHRQIPPDAHLPWEHIIK